MCAMIFKRTLHPVGHGAFLTEQFKDSKNDIWYHVAYDCGSFSKESLYKEIDSIDRYFDFMFISHFDSDHVNGLKRLIEKNLINDKTKIVIPFIYPGLIKILLPEMKDEMSPDTFDSVEAMFNSKATIIGLDENLINYVRNNEYQYNIRTESFYINRHVHGFSLFNLNHNKDEKICWFYMPYNTITEDGRKERFLEEIGKCFEIIESFFKLRGSKGPSNVFFEKYSLKYSQYISKDFLEELLVEFSIDFICDISTFKPFRHFIEHLIDLIEKKPSDIKDSKFQFLIHVIKELYKKASPGIKGVTAINVNSLNLLSFGAESLKEQSNQILKYSKGDFEVMNKKLFFFPKKDKDYDAYKVFMNEISKKSYYNSNMQQYSFSALYTGDCMMEDNFFNCIDIICNNVIHSPLGLLQIPHHGSKNNYNQLILSKPIFSSFINFSSTRKESSNVKEIEKDFFKIVRPCFEITQEDESRFEQFVVWEESLFFNKPTKT